MPLRTRRWMAAPAAAPRLRWSSASPRISMLRFMDAPSLIMCYNNFNITNSNASALRQQPEAWHRQKGTDDAPSEYHFGALLTPLRQILHRPQAAHLLDRKSVV